MVPFVGLDARLLGRKSTGDSTYWAGLVHGLAELGHAGRTLLFSDRPRPTGVPSEFRWIEVPGRSQRLWSLARFPLAARRAGVEAVHTQYAVSPLARKAVTTVHDVSFLVEPAWFAPKDRWLLGAAVRNAARRRLEILTVSATSADEIRRLVPGARVRWAWIGPAPGIGPVPETEALAALEALGVERPYLLSVGTDWPRKNVGLAVESARLAGLRLVLTGRARPGDEPHVVRTGYVDERALSALYCQALAALVPSRHEGFGLPVAEAFACGCPVVCSTGGALPEVAGGAAEVVPGFEPGEWAARVRRLADDPSILASMRERGLERARAFDWKQHAKTAVEAYKAAARGGDGE